MKDSLALIMRNYAEYRSFRISKPLHFFSFNMGLEIFQKLHQIVYKKSRKIELFRSHCISVESIPLILITL